MAVRLRPWPHQRIALDGGGPRLRPELPLRQEPTTAASVPRAATGNIAPTGLDWSSTWCHIATGRRALLRLREAIWRQGWADGCGGREVVGTARGGG